MDLSGLILKGGLILRGGLISQGCVSCISLAYRAVEITHWYLPNCIRH